LVTADFNGDGNMDVAVGMQDGGIALYLGAGDGTFLPPTILPGQAIAAITTADLRGTGRQDIIAVSYSVKSLQPYIDRYWNIGDGTFERGPGLLAPQAPSCNQYNECKIICDAPGCAAIQVTDMNGDGRPDLVYLSIGDPGTISILLGDGSGGFQPPVTDSIGFLYDPAYVAVADFNRDGKPDIAFATPATATPVVVMLGNGDGTLQAPLRFGTVALTLQAPLVTADFNRDGIPDIAVQVCTGTAVASCEQAIQIFLGNGDGTFREPTTTPSAFGLGINSVGGSVMEAVDMNGDSIPDLVLYGQSEGGSGMIVFYGNPDGTVEPPVIISPVGLFGDAGGSDFGVADFNHDGHMDMITIESLGAGTAPYTLLQVLLGGNSTLR
jgi:FG-GAP-like repeat